MKVIDLIALLQSLPEQVQSMEVGSWAPLYVGKYTLCDNNDDTDTFEVNNEQLNQIKKDYGN